MPNIPFHRYICIILVLIIPTGKSFSQSIPDSLRKKLEHAAVYDRPEILNLVAKNMVYEYPAEALKYAKQALQESDHLGNSNQYVKALLLIGDSHFYLEEFEKAEENYLRALDLSQELEKQDLIAHSNYYLGYLYDTKNDGEKAGQYYEIAIAMYDSLNRKDMVAELSYLYADMLTKKADNYLAKNHFDNALKIYLNSGRQNDAAETLNSMGLLFYNMGNYEKAIEYYNRSRELMQKIGNKTGVAQALNNLGILYQNSGNIEEALNHYQESLRLDDEHNDKPGIAGTFNNIGLIYAVKGDNNKAIDYYEKSLALYEELDNKSGIATVLNNLGESFMDLGETDVASVMLKKAITIELEIEDKHGVAFAYATMSEIYLQAGNLELSRQYNDSSLAICAERNIPEVTLAVYENYYKISKAAGDYKNALQYFAQKTALKDSVFNKNLLKQLSEVKAQYELEQKEQEIALLNSTNQISQLDLKNKQDVVYRQRLVLIIVLGAFLAILAALFFLYRQTREKRAAFKSLDEKNRELLKNREELIIAKDKAEESDRLKSTFLANMSHELRTPLNGILGFTEVLRTEIYDEVYREMADIVHTSGTRLLDTLNSIIDLSIIESSRMDIDHQKIKLDEFVDEAITLFRASAFKKDLLLTGETESDFDYIISDRKVLANLINNLIDNAIKYTGDGSVQVKAIVVPENESYQLKISVTDTGIGIDNERLKHIFDKFRQGSEGHDRQFEGAGLGLTICKKYVELLKGRIIATSESNKGSEFRIEIPVKVSGSVSHNQPDADNIKTELPLNRHEAPRVLIVENDDINLKHLVYILKSWCTLKTAKNGDEAIGHALKNKFDIILMDINLGAGPNGMQTAKRIRLIEGFADIPIVAVTANAMKGHREEFLANGCTHYLSKPFSANQLKNIIVDAVA